MGKLILFNVAISVDGNDLEDRARSVSCELSATEQDVTCFGGDGWEDIMQGIKSGNYTIEFFQDFDAGAVHDTLYPLFVSGESFDLVIVPDGETPSTSNPALTAPVRLMTYNVLQGEVGNASPNPVTFRAAGAPSISHT